MVICLCYLGPHCNCNALKMIKKVYDSAHFKPEALTVRKSWWFCVELLLSLLRSLPLRLRLEMCSSRRCLSCSFSCWFCCCCCSKRRSFSASSCCCFMACSSCWSWETELTLVCKRGKLIDLILKSLCFLMNPAVSLLLQRTIMWFSVKTKVALSWIVLLNAQFCWVVCLLLHFLMLSWHIQFSTVSALCHAVLHSVLLFYATLYRAVLTSCSI